VTVTPGGPERRVVALERLRRPPPGFPGATQQPSLRRRGCSELVRVLLWEVISMPLGAPPTTVAATPTCGLSSPIGAEASIRKMRSGSTAHTSRTSSAGRTSARTNRQSTSSAGRCARWLRNAVAPPNSTTTSPRSAPRTDQAQPHEADGVPALTQPAAKGAALRRRSSVCTCGRCRKGTGRYGRVPRRTGAAAADPMAPAGR
jgi:hypothetical protein